ncbi:MAG TPA: cytochrome c oxidase subunit 3, partial [Candidatus Acidoferrales bacterium]|nr:cytochrome c oxidase subunit 3 [Candidatus Acidoferrales bacterium]
QRVYPTGMILTLGAILMFFMALISAFVVRKGLSTSPLEGPIGLPWRFLSFNTALLVASSGALEVSRRSLRSGATARFRTWWYTATALGLAFLIGQFAAWRVLASQGTYLASNPNASFFYLFTGAHAFHLIGGIIALLVIALRPLRRLTQSTATRIAAMYWHFLTIVWAGIFLLLIFAK